MRKNKVVLKCENAISDNPNMFIRMCLKLSSTYGMNISSMKGFSSSDRSFEVELVGQSSFIEIKFDYENQGLEYQVHFKDEEVEECIERQIVEAITKVRFNRGETIYDWLGNKYIVVDDENRPVVESGAIPHYKIQVTDEHGNQKEILNMNVSLWF